MRIAITGASGLIGTRLALCLKEGGHTIHPLVRSTPNEAAGEIFWNPAKSEIDASSLNGVQAVVHLAGESISGRWSAKKKTRIRESRIQGTTLIAETLASLGTQPDTLVSASAVGFYGHRKAEILTEKSSGGSGFLAKVCFGWEACAEPARRSGIRVVHPRLGIVISERGGALGSMLAPFKMGAGGVVGTGDQYMSWISIADATSAIAHILSEPDLEGPVNLTSPNPVTNRQFTKLLGEALGRPTLLPLPSPVVSLLMGEMGETLLMHSARVLPQRLLQTGFEFEHRELELAFLAVL